MKPVLQALVLAERVYEDVTGKKIIAGTFNKVLISTQPIIRKDDTGRTRVQGGTDIGCPFVYVSLTDVVNGTEIELQMVDVSRNCVLFRTKLTLEPNDRLLTVEIVAGLPRLRSFVRQPGTYTMDAVWRGEILGSHRLTVDEVELPTEEGNDDDQS